MGVYVVSWALSRETNSETEVVQEFKTVLQVVTNALSKYEAAEAVAATHLETADAQEGWELTGNPSVLTVTQTEIDSWVSHVDSPPANKRKRPSYLQPVETIERFILRVHSCMDALIFIYACFYVSVCFNVACTNELSKTPCRYSEVMFCSYK